LKPAAGNSAREENIHFCWPEILSSLEANWTLPWLEQQSQRRTCAHVPQKKLLKFFKANSTKIVGI